MGQTIIMEEDRLFPSDPIQRQIARRLYGEVKDLPIISPHGHTDPRWYADDIPFSNPSDLFLIPDHYLFRMLYSRGVPLEKLGIPRADDHSGQLGRVQNSSSKFKRRDIQPEAGQPSVHPKRKIPKRQT